MNKSLLSVLEIIQVQPYAYLGSRREADYSALAGFITGFAYGVKYAVHDLSLEVFPRDFNEFVKATLNGRYGAPKYGRDEHWVDVILSEAGTQDAAFKLFFELFDAFRKHYPHHFDKL